LLAVVEHVDERAFADFKPEQIGKQPRKPLERNRLGEAQVDGEGPQVRPERRPSIYRTALFYPHAYEA
jgi:hypothetical protein